MTQERQTFTLAQTTLFPTDDEDFIHFEFGTPGLNLLPREQLKRAAAECFSNEGMETYLQYGPSLGCLRFRTHLAEFLNKEYSQEDIGTFRVDPNHLVVTNGASQSFSNILTLFTTQNTRFYIENPTYFVAIRVLEDHGIHRDSTITVPVDDDGLKVDVLESLLESNSASTSAPESTYGEKRFKNLLFLVPTFSNPTGRTLSLERRKKLLALAQKHDMLIVCDDVYHLLHYHENQRPPPRLVALDLQANPNGFGNVISNQSFSKIVGPGLRLGWIEAPPGIVNQYLKSGLMYSGGSPNHFTSGILGWALAEPNGGLVKRNMEVLRTEFRDRLDFVCNYLRQNLPDSVQFTKPTGGYFIWIKLPGDHDTQEILKCIKEGGTYRVVAISKSKVSFAPGVFFSSDGSNRNCLRLTFAHYPKEKLELGLKRLTAVLSSVL